MENVEENEIEISGLKYHSKESSTVGEKLSEDSVENIEDRTFLVQEDVITKTLQLFEYFDTRSYCNSDANGLNGSKKENRCERNMDYNDCKSFETNGNSHENENKNENENENENKGDDDNSYSHVFNPDHGSNNDKNKNKEKLISIATKATHITERLTTRPDRRTFLLFLQALSMSYNKNKKERLETVINNSTIDSRVTPDVIFPTALLSSSSSSSSSFPLPSLTSSLSSTLASTTSRAPSTSISTSTTVRTGACPGNASVSSTSTAPFAAIAPSLPDNQHPSGLQSTVSSDLNTALASQILQKTLQRHLDELDLDGVSAAVAQGAIIDPSHIKQAAKHFDDEHIPLFSLLLSGGEVYIADR